jgi:hypothetical protein
MSVEDADYFELLDNIEYKYLRHIIKDNILISVEVNVEDTGEQNHDGDYIKRASFTFDLNSDKEWVIQNNFTWTSCFGISLSRKFAECFDGDTEEEEDIYSEPSSPKSVIS